MARRPIDPRAAAEAAFRPKAPPAPAPERKQGVPGAREMVTLRIDSDVLELFQSDGAGWQDRINDTLREAVRGRLTAASGGGAIPVDQLTSENDDGAG
ncbi:BrnA antitoxin family protein [Hansschlegelia beijingensis]|uniref:BrnA antitoxin family protein n=1 Tax=Hansschlegelia beijingensis TaxID=1133344 RepID=UPI00387F1BED